MQTIGGLYNYWAVIILMMAGLYILIARYNLIKKMIGLGLFQTSIFYLYITIGKVSGGTAPILTDTVPAGQLTADHLDAGHLEAAVSSAAPAIVYSNPLPHVLILTAIVVGVATTAVALALSIRIYEAYGTIEDDEIRLIDLGDTES
jgi:multicomponent Na+:H+ antiporter subunit C